MTLPDINHDCPDAEDEIYGKAQQAERQSAVTDRHQIDEEDSCPERLVAICCIAFAAVMLVFVYFILPTLYH